MSVLREKGGGWGGSERERERLNRERVERSLRKEERRSFDLTTRKKKKKKKNVTGCLFHFGQDPLGPGDARVRPEGGGEPGLVLHRVERVLLPDGELGRRPERAQGRPRLGRLGKEVKNEFFSLLLFLILFQREAESKQERERLQRERERDCDPFPILIQVAETKHGKRERRRVEKRERL